MDEIRASQFDLSDKKVNGFVAIAMQLNPKVQEMKLDDIIELEENEYQNILEELDNLDVLSEDESIPLETDEYLIYKLEKDCHVTTSIPANEFTKQFYQDELKRIEDALD
jgi:DNA-directed RNA polymerase specialized sigma subunit